MVLTSIVMLLYMLSYSLAAGYITCWLYEKILFYRLSDPIGQRKVVTIVTGAVLLVIGLIPVIILMAMGAINPGILIFAAAQPMFLHMMYAHCEDPKKAPSDYTPCIAHYADLHRCRRTPCLPLHGE